jgi:hypothetical protein
MSSDASTYKMLCLACLAFAQHVHCANAGLLDNFMCIVQCSSIGQWYAAQQWHGHFGHSRMTELLQAKGAL